MDISAGLIAKGTAGALAASAAVGTGIIAKNNDWFGFFKSSVEKNLTKFDEGLIDFLGIDGGDIVFDVKKGDGTDNFAASDLTISSSTNPLPITAKVIVDTSSDANLKVKTGNTDPKGKKETLQKLNGGGTNTAGTAWTWICKIIFNASGETANKEIHEKEKILKSNGNDGLFDWLKKNVSNETNTSTKQKAKQIKEKFIRLCAASRDNTALKDKNASLTGNKLETSITINLKAGATDNADGQTDVNKLYPSSETDKNIFKGLFDKGVEQTTSN